MINEEEMVGEEEVGPNVRCRFVDSAFCAGTPCRCPVHPQKKLKKSVAVKYEEERKSLEEYRQRWARQWGDKWKKEHCSEQRKD
jgi:hypothetical protein